MKKIALPALNRCFTATLVAAVFGCGNSGNHDQGSGGKAGSVGLGGTTAAGGSNGMIGSGGSAGMTVTATGGSSGGPSASGGAAGSAAAAGAATGGTASAGATGGGGASTAGVGGGTRTGGTSGVTGGASNGGAAVTGGEAGRSMGGAGQSSGGAAGAPSTGRSISFGTLLDAQAVVAAAKTLAASIANPQSAQWRAKGDQHRSYRFAEANTTSPYRLYVPSNWDGQSKLPLVMFLHGSGSDENSYVDQNNKQMLTLAQQHGFLLVAPLGDKGAYGNFLRLASPFGKPEEAAKLMAQVTADSERTNELSEKDVINVLELVLAEYPIDPAAMFLSGHSMGSGGTWYIGGKYAQYWKGLAPMSGPFVQQTGYPWDSVRPIYLFVTEGTQTPSLDGSRALRTWLTQENFKAEYKEVNADHGGMISLVLPDVFDFFARNSAP